MSNWPWPLDGVQNWFENLYNNIQNWIWDAISTIWEILPQWIKQALNTVGTISTWVTDTIWNKLRWVANKLSDAYTWITDTIWDKLRWVADKLSSAYNWIVNTIWDKLKWVAGRINDVYAYVTNTIWNGITWLKDQIGNVSAWIGSAVSSAVTTLKTYFEDVVHGALAGVAEALGEGLKALWKWVVGGLSWLAESLAGLVQWARDKLSAVFRPVIVSLQNQITEGITVGTLPKDIEESSRQMAENMGSRVKAQIDELYSSPLEMGKILSVATGISGTALGVASMAMMLGSSADAAHPVKNFGFRDITKTMLGYLGTTQLVMPPITLAYEIGVQKPLRRLYNSMYKPELPAPPDLIRMYVREAFIEEKWAEYPEAMTGQLAELGFTEDWAKAFWGAHWELPEPRRAQELVNRGLITEDSYMQILKELDIDPRFREQMAKLRFVIPPIPDLVRFVVREAFPLEELPEAPGEFADAMIKHGVDPKWSKAYWWAHWKLPSARRLYDGFHRGIIDEGEMKAFLKWLDYSPDPRPGISKNDIDIMLEMSYHLIGRIDLRRGWELGALDEEEMVEGYKKLGYSPDDADLMTDIMKRVGLRAEIGTVRREMVDDFEDGFIDEDTLVSNLDELGLVPEVRDYYVEKAKLRRERDRKKDYVKIYKKAFAEDTITRGEFEGHLLNLGLQDWKVSAVVNYELAKKGLKIKGPVGA